MPGKMTHYQALTWLSCDGLYPANQILEEEEPKEAIKYWQFSGYPRQRTANAVSATSADSFAFFSS
jgi:hypothetical protein